VAVLLLLQKALPARLGDGLELLVAVMLVALGARGVQKALREGRQGPSQPHHHGPLAHVHAGHHTHVHMARTPLSLRPLLIGLVHGLAGSGALCALALAHMPTTALRLFYAALFGAGSIIGMALLSALASWPLMRLGQRPGLRRLLMGSTGAVSVGLGAFWGWPLVQRLLGA
jgi:hypothetical protein